MPPKSSQELFGEIEVLKKEYEEAKEREERIRLQAEITAKREELNSDLLPNVIKLLRDDYPDISKKEIIEMLMDNPAWGDQGKKNIAEAVTKVEKEGEKVAVERREVESERSEKKERSVEPKNPILEILKNSAAKQAAVLAIVLPAAVNAGKHLYTFMNI